MLQVGAGKGSVIMSQAMIVEGLPHRARPGSLG